MLEVNFMVKDLWVMTMEALIVFTRNWFMTQIMSFYHIATSWVAF